jgi:hypothetical protein
MAVDLDTLIALALAGATLVPSVAALLYLVLPSARNKRRSVVATLACLMVLNVVVAVWVYYFTTTTPLRRKLPWSASDIHEQYVDMFPDYTTYLKARLPESDFPEYIERLGLTPHQAGRTYSDDTRWLSWDPAGRRPSWFDPSDDLSMTCVCQRGHVWTFAKHERGFVYVKSLSH